MSEVESRQEWYFVCLRCDCKFFHRKPAAECPRCRAELTSNEQLTPPWRICRRMQARFEYACGDRRDRTAPEVD